LALCIRWTNWAPMWQDEIYSYLLISDPSFSHMFSSCKATINPGPPLYFFVGWFWAQLFGNSEISLRLFTSIAISGGIFVLWYLLRRHFSFVASLIPLYVCSLSGTLLQQNHDVRFYGMVFLLFVITLYRIDIWEHNKREGKIGKKDYIFLFLPVLLLTFTHFYGIIFLLFTLFWTLLTNLWHYLKDRQPSIRNAAEERSFLRALDWKLTAVFLTAFALFGILWGPVVLSQSAELRSYTWLPRPTPPLMFEAFVQSRPIALLAVGAILLSITAAFISLRRPLPPEGEQRITKEDQKGIPLLVSLSVFLLFGPMLTVAFVSTIGKSSLFFPRYFLCVQACWAIFIAYCIDYIVLSGSFVKSPAHLLRWQHFPLLTRQEASHSSTRPGILIVCIVWLGLTVLIGGWNIKSAAEIIRRGKPLQWDAAVQNIEGKLAVVNAPKDLPVLLRNWTHFTEVAFAATDKQKYWFPLDPDFALCCGRSHGNHHWHAHVILTNIKNHYSLFNITEWHIFIKDHPQFLIYHTRYANNVSWVESRLKSLPEYQIKLLTPPNDMEEIWLVTKKSPVVPNAVEAR
jgi:hypothetical protein